MNLSRQFGYFNKKWPTLGVILILCRQYSFTFILDDDDFEPDIVVKPKTNKEWDEEDTAIVRVRCPNNYLPSNLNIFI